MHTSKFEGQKRVPGGSLVDSHKSRMGICASKALSENMVNGGKTQRPDMEARDAIGTCNSKCGFLEVTCGRPEGNQESDFSGDPSSREFDRLSAGAIEPLEVVDRNQCRSSVGEPLQNGEIIYVPEGKIKTSIWSQLSSVATLGLAILP